MSSPRDALIATSPLCTFCSAKWSAAVELSTLGRALTSEPTDPVGEILGDELFHDGVELARHHHIEAV